ncbi:MAG: hypothetical protein LBQ84_02245 [Flavobacteriaceae bacterium]|jgi:hypothetical protein|nr:hypothetical protein [Flavobacteriaceae bacterium]
MKKIYSILSITILCTFPAMAQIAVGGTEPTEGAIIDLNSTNLGGLVLSNVWLVNVEFIPGSNEFVGISSATPQDENLNLEGMVVWNINPDVVGGGGKGKDEGPYVWDGYRWRCLGCGDVTPIDNPDLPVRLAYVDVTTGGPNGGGFDGTLNGNARGYPAKGKIIDKWIEFMPYNLGADKNNIQGNMYYQWGRNSDGHESSSSFTTNTLVNAGSYTPGHSLFITNGVNTVGDWITGSSNNYPGRWGGGSTPGTNSPEYSDPSPKGVNDPCDEGFRVPSIDEWAGIFAGRYNGGGEVGTYSDISYNGKYEGANKWVYISNYNGTGVAGWLVYPPKTIKNASNQDVIDDGYYDAPTDPAPLFLPVTGVTGETGGLRLGANYDKISGGWDEHSPLGVIIVDYKSYYWSSSSTSTYLGFSQAMRLYKDGNEFRVANIGMPRANGLRVRCIKE